MGNSPDCLEAAATGYIAIAALYIVMAALYTVVAALYIALPAFYFPIAALYFTMATLYTAMAIYYLEHSRKLCSHKVSSTALVLTRADPPIFPRCPHLKMVSYKDQPVSKKNKLDNIATRKEHCRFSKEETEGAVTTSAPDKLVPFTMVPAIRDPSMPWCTPVPCWTLCRTLSPTKS